MTVLSLFISFRNVAAFHLEENEFMIYGERGSVDSSQGCLYTKELSRMAFFLSTCVCLFVTINMRF